MKNAVISDSVTGHLTKMLQDTAWRHESFDLYPACPILILRMRDNRYKTKEHRR